VKYILVVHQGAIGDFILSLPALEAIHRFYPEAGFKFIGHPEILEIIRGRPYVKHVLDCSAANWTPLYNSGGRLASTDLDLLLPADAVFVFGRSSSQIMADNLAHSLGEPTHRLDPFPEPKLHITVADYQCGQLQELGIPAMPPPEAIIAPSQQDVLEARDFVSRNLEPGDRLVLLHPGSGGKNKLWTPTGWLSIIHQLSAQPELRFALLQGPADTRIVQHLRSQLDTNSLIQVKNWRLGKLAALMSNGALFVGNDSGITHLAAASGAPTIALFGHTDPLIWGPRGAKIRIVRWQPETPANMMLEPEKIPAQPGEVEIVLNQAREWLGI